MRGPFKVPTIGDRANLESTRLREPTDPPPPPADGLAVSGVPLKGKDDRIISVSKRFPAGYAETIGFRDSMEDSLVICGNFRNRPDEDYFAVFDGHAGHEASSYCAKNLHLILTIKLNQEGVDIPTCMVQSFKETHETMKTFKSEKGTITESGSTALVALFLQNELYIANAGDSRAVFSQDRKAILITEDHKPTLEREVKRICSISGGFILKNRVQGKLAVARSIGDFKWNPYVSEEPDVFGPFNWLESQYEFLILACDGLWDVLDEQKACDMARECKNPRDAAIRLRDWAYNERSRDNISVVVIWFPGFVPDLETQDESSGSGEASSSASGSEASGSADDESGSASTSRESDSDDEDDDDEDEQDHDHDDDHPPDNETTHPDLHLTAKGVTGNRQLSNSSPSSSPAASPHVQKLKISNLDETASRSYQDRSQKTHDTDVSASDSGNPAAGVSGLLTPVASPHNHT